MSRVGSLSGAAFGVLVGTAAFAGGFLVLFAPWWVRTLRELATERRERVRAEERADMAAHIHDSVLQTLALVQKAANQYDDAVASLNLYLLTQPADARDAQDEIYKLEADKETTAAQKSIEDQRAQQQAVAASPKMKWLSRSRQFRWPLVISGLTINTARACPLCIAATAVWMPKVADEQATFMSKP